MWEELLSEWNATEGDEKNIFINWKTTTDSTTIDVAEQNGSLPHIFNVSGNQLKQFIARKSAISINELPGGEEFLKEYGQDGIETKNLVDGKQYSVYMNVRTSGLAYNKDLVTSPLSSYYSEKDAQNSKEYLDLDKGTYDMSNYHEMFDWILQMKKDGSLFPGAETLDNDTARAYFAAGAVGMIPAISWDVSVFNNQFKAECDWDICPYPAPDGREVYKQWCQRGGGMLIGRSAAEKNPEETMEVYKFIYSLNTRKVIFERGVNLSAKTDVLEVYDKDAVDPRFVKFAELVDETVRFAEHESVAVEGEDFKTLFQKVWMGDITLDKAIDDYSARYERGFKKAVAAGEYDVAREKRVRRYLQGEDGFDLSKTN